MMHSRLAAALLLAGLLGLAGCATMPAPSPKVCAPLAAYSQTQQARAADELDALPADSVLARMIADYGQLRAMLRACAKG